MALVLSKSQVDRFETAFKSAWANANDDGCGIYWRDMKGERHLARFPKSEDLAKVGTTYDRMLIHFRKSTKGEGTHPFTCKHRPKLNSGNWLLVHNGCVQDEEARKELIKTHTFSTEIDSEVFVHIWGEIKEKNLLKRAKKFNEAREKANITGWANLIFYNVVTDEWVALSDGSLSLVCTKDTLVICSDDTWLDMTEANRRKIPNASLPTGAIAYGKGLVFKTKADIWKIHYSSSQTTLPTVVNGKMLYSGCRDYTETWKPQNIPRGRPEWSASAKSFVDEKGNPLEWDSGKRAFVDSKGFPIDNNSTQYGNPNGHYFQDSEYEDANGEPYCDICFMPREYHSLDAELDELEKEDKEREARQKETTAIDRIASSRIDESVWNKAHPFTRNFNAQTITCMCGSTTGYGILHKAHDFYPLMTKQNKPTGYCQVCGNERAVGNHKEMSYEGHFFTPLRIEENKGDGKIFYSESTICGRCGFRESIHPMSYDIQTKQITTIEDATTMRIKPPMDCGCKPSERPKPIICSYHWGCGFHEADNYGFIIKRIAYDSGRVEPN
jgi:predicted glutamine amidotransferase